MVQAIEPRTENHENPVYARTGKRLTGVSEASSDDRLSKKEHKADALALGADEGRGKLRKAAVRCKQPFTRRYPNGATHPE